MSDDRQVEAGLDDADRALLAEHGRRLLDLARASISHGFEFGRPLPVDIGNEPRALAEPRACQVILRLRAHAPAGQRRRAGGVRVWRPLLMDVSGNAFAAAFADRRHAPLRPAERFDVSVTLRLLGLPRPVAPDDARSLALLAPGACGVLVEWPGGSLALDPEAWAHCSTPAEFVAEATRRALGRGLDPGETPRVYRFSVASIGDGEATPSQPSP